VRLLPAPVRLIDNSPTGELLDSVDPKDYKPVVDACTLCDMCFMTKCPYVPPHEFNLDFPHLMLRYRAAELCPGQERPITAAADRDRPQRQARRRWWRRSPTGRRTAQRPDPPMLEGVAGIDRDADLPKLPPDLPASSRSTRPRSTRRRRLRPQGRALCDLLRQVQQPGIGRAPRRSWP
jgi:hypothetical protein